jgi:hypothetical protein
MDLFITYSGDATTRPPEKIMTRHSEAIAIFWLLFFGTCRSSMFIV